MFRAVLHAARPLVLLLLAFAVGACSTAGAAAPSGSAPPAPLDPDEPVFVVGYEGGFLAPITNVSRLPLIVVYGDGRVVVQGPQIEIWPSPLVPNLQVRTLSAEALERLIDLARDKGLLRTVRYDFPGIADAPDTVLTIDLDGETYRVSAYALAEGAELETGRDLDQATREGRAALRSFIETLTALPEADFVNEWTTFEAEAIRLYVTPMVGIEDPELGEQPAVDWPLEDLATAGTQIGDASLGLRCVEVAGEDLATALPLLGQANVLTPFESGGERYQLVVRPQLPYESGC
mgnify:CR=1 FL=1